MTFGEKLQMLRTRRGLSQDALAEALEVSRQAVEPVGAERDAARDRKSDPPEPVFFRYYGLFAVG